MKLRILADAQLSRVREAFSNLGEVTFYEAGSLTAESLRAADVLLVRSVTQVGEELLAGTPVRFVGTATSGTDHVNMDYLDREGIGFAHAGGCNADAVADYCLAAMAALCDAQKLKTMRVGIVGYGFVGSELVRRLEALGVAVEVCDPPLADSGIDRHFSSLEAVARCDVVSLHVPLTRAGKYPTENLIGAGFLQALNDEAVMINSCRAGVVDEEALLELLGQKKELRYAADVWLGEPDPAPELVSASSLATPHVAGYSRRAKLNATLMLSRELAEFLAASELSQPMTGDDDPLVWEVGSSLPWSVAATALPLTRLSARFKGAVAAGRGAREFREIRQELLTRREFGELRPQADAMTEAERAQLKALGFSL